MLKEDFALIKEAAYRGAAGAAGMGIIAWVETQILENKPALPGSVLAGDLAYVCDLAENGGAETDLVAAVRAYIK